MLKITRILLSVSLLIITTNIAHATGASSLEPDEKALIHGLNKQSLSDRTKEMANIKKHSPHVHAKIVSHVHNVPGGKMPLTSGSTTPAPGAATGRMRSQTQ